MAFLGRPRNDALAPLNKARKQSPQGRRDLMPRPPTLPEFSLLWTLRKTLSLAFKHVYIAFEMVMVVGEAK